MDMKKYFVLKDNVILVNGALRGLIMDLNNKKIFSINSTAKEYLNKLTNGNSIESVLANLLEKDKNKLIDYVKLLVSNNLAVFSDKSETSGYYKHKKQIQTNLNTVWFELRKACNLNCVHCYMDCSSTRDKDLELLSLKQWKKIINELKEFKVKRIILIGGEPLLFKNIKELILYCRKILNEAEIILYSNLTLLNEDLEKIIKDNNVKVITSLYSNTAEIHDKITGHAGSFNKTVKNIKRLKENNIFVKANIVVMKYNEYNISETREFTYNLTGIKSKIDIVRDVGQSKENLIPEHSNIKIKRNLKVLTKQSF